MENKTNNTTQQASIDDLDLILAESKSQPSQPQKPASNNQPQQVQSTKINNPFEVSKYKTDQANNSRVIARHKYVPSKVGLTVGVVGLCISFLALIGAVIMLFF